MSSKNLSWSQNDKISNSTQNLVIVRIFRRNFFERTKKETAGQSFSSLCIEDPAEGLKLRGGGKKLCAPPHLPKSEGMIALPLSCPHGSYGPALDLFFFSSGLDPIVFPEGKPTRFFSKESNYVIDMKPGMYYYTRLYAVGTFPLIFLASQWTKTSGKKDSPL